MAAGIRRAFFLAAALAATAAATAGEEPRRSGDRIEVIKVWASDEPQKDEKAAGPKDELKDYRDRLEKETKKRHFSIESKVVEDAVPDKSINVPLIDDCRLQMTPVVEGKGKDQKLVLRASVYKKDVEKRTYIWRKFPVLYCTPIQRQGRELVVIVQKSSGVRA